MARKRGSRKARKKTARPARAARRFKRDTAKRKKVAKRPPAKAKRTTKRPRRKARRRRVTPRKRPREIVSATLGFETLVSGVSKEKPEESGAPKSRFDSAPEKTTTFQDKAQLNRLLMLVVDPHYAFTYWELNPESMLQAADKIGSDTKLTLRFYDTTSAKPEAPYGDVEVFDGRGNWYLKMEYPQQHLQLEIGMKASTGEFTTIARSDVMRITKEMLAHPGPIKWITFTPGEERSAPTSEQYEDADPETLKKILGPYFYELLVRGRMSSIAGSSMEAVFHNIQALRERPLL